MGAARTPEVPGTGGPVRGSVGLVIGVDGDDENPADHVALELAADGARVVVVGSNEHAVAARVGEIVFGGGHARHVAGDPGAGSTIAAALRKAGEAFGQPATFAVLGPSAACAAEHFAEFAPNVRCLALTGSGDTSIVLSKFFEG